MPQKHKQAPAYPLMNSNNSKPKQKAHFSMLKLIQQERNLLLGLAIAFLAYSFEHSLLHSGQTTALISGIFLIGAIVLVSMRVAHHAEMLAEKVGEPYGTMLLTISAVLVEVVILSIMMSHGSSPTLARDTIYSAVMLDINGILGIAAIIGGLKYGEQKYNVDSGNTYVIMILTAMGVSMMIPEFIPATSWQTYSIFSIVIMIFLYGMFLKLQTTNHSYFFSFSYAETGSKSHHAHPGKTSHSAMLLISGLVIIGALAEVMSQTLTVGTTGMGIPPVFFAIIVAGISASPEILTAFRAALANRMQPVVNIALGASLSTVVLTVPVIEFMALMNDQPIIMALTPTQTIMAFLTLIITGINLHDGETNAIEGTTHFVLFATFIMLAFLGL